MFHLSSIIALLLPLISARNTNVLMTEVFEVVIDPTIFNWTYEGIRDQFVYEASLHNCPDLPSWIHYMYSDKHHKGFLYGVPPAENAVVPLEIVAINKRNYETRVEPLNIIVSSKLNPAGYEVHMKIDNLNVEDMFEVERMDALKDIFKKQLWKDSEEDLYVTFLNSAVDMGARKPLNPNQGEGVIVRLGSEVPFSEELLGLQDEIKPLKSLPFCPRDYKRTSVERNFRDAGFTLDWCNFKLIQIDGNNPAMHHVEASTDDSNHDVSDTTHIYSEKWQGISRNEVPLRNYTKELLVSVLIPIFLMVALILILTFLLCFEHDDLIDLSESNFAASTQQPSFFNTNPKSSDMLCILNNRELTLSPDPILLSRSHADSPSSTIGRGVHCRPSPPPYVRPKYKPDF